MQLWYADIFSARQCVKNTRRVKFKFVENEKDFKAHYKNLWREEK